MVKRDKLRILAAGDMHGDSGISERLAKMAERENVDLVILSGDMFGMVRTKNIIKPFLDRGKRVVFVPGNWETKEEAKKIAEVYGIKDLGQHYVKYKDVGIFGLGNPDFSLYPDDALVFKKLKSENEKIKNLEKKILVSHLHAAGTKSELSGFEGNLALRRAIEEFQPDLFIHSHIHELEGAEEKIGKTRVVNVGRKGRIFEI